MRFPILIEKLTKIIFALFLTVAVSGIQPLPMVQAQGQKFASLDQFDLMTASSGWILLDQHLFWTSTIGQTWE